MVEVGVDVGVAAVLVGGVQEWEEEGWDDQIPDGWTLEDLTADLTQDRCPLGVGVRNMENLKDLDTIRTCSGQDLIICGAFQACPVRDTLM